MVHKMGERFTDSDLTIIARTGPLAERLVAEVRRLRGLIASAVPQSVITAPSHDSSRALVAEAQAIEKELQDKP